MRHTKECVRDRRRADQARRAYQRRWPRYCHTCEGWGLDSWTENQAPLGSGRYWPERFTDVCPDCAGVFRCPRCNGPWAPSPVVHKIELSRACEVLVEDLWKALEMTGQHFGIALAKPNRRNGLALALYRLEPKIILIDQTLAKVDYKGEPPDQCPYCGFDVAKPEGMPPAAECYCYELEDV